MRYLLDICVISDFISGEPGTHNRLKQTAPTEIAVSAITVMEIQYGLALNPQKAAKIAATIHDFLASIHLLQFTAAEAQEAAQIRALLKPKGQPIGAYDVLIAATALHHNLVMVTANQREFQRVPGLQLENWCEENEMPNQ